MAAPTKIIITNKVGFDENANFSLFYIKFKELSVSVLKKNFFDRLNANWIAKWVRQKCYVWAQLAVAPSIVCNVKNPVTVPVLVITTTLPAVLPTENASISPELVA